MGQGEVIFNFVHFLPQRFTIFVHELLFPL